MHSDKLLYFCLIKVSGSDTVEEMKLKLTPEVQRVLAHGGTMLVESRIAVLFTTFCGTKHNLLLLLGVIPLSPGWSLSGELTVSVVALNSVTSQDAQL